MATFEDSVEPERHLGQLHSNRVQVHPEDIAVGAVHLHPLLFFGVLLVRDGATQLFLFGLQVGFG
ncbi:hypothetical protein D9M71_757130 [compost metagenome]